VGYAATALAWLAASPAGAAPTTLAYYESNSQPALRAESRHLRQIAADSYAIDAAGKVSGAVTAAMLNTAKAARIQVFAAVSNFGANGFSEQIAHAVLTGGAAQSQAIQSLVVLAATHGFAGVNLDFENVAHTDRAAYSSFVLQLGAALHAQKSLLVVSVPAALSDNPADGWTGAFDYAAIGAACDIFQLMTYDENGPWGLPGPVAGLDWVTASLAYTLTAVPAPKISLGMAAYGYDWNSTRHTGVQVAESAVPALIARTGGVPQWDSATSSPWFDYVAGDGSSHVVWYENARSAQTKATLVRQHSLAGVSVYALGFDDPAYWAAIAAGLRSKTHRF